VNAPLVSLEDIDSIAVIGVDNPPVNTIDARVRRGLSEAIATLSERKTPRAAILHCVGNTFFSGADIGEFSGPPREAEYRQLCERLERCSFPIVAAMHGTVLGGGLEIALACHYRIAAPDARFGMPEITLGVIPGAGGTQRMPRLIGVEKTLELVLSAAPVAAHTGMSLGFIDAIVEGELRAAAIEYARGLIARDAVPRRTGDRCVDPASATPEIIARAKAQAIERYPHRKAALIAVEAIAAAARLPLQDGLEYEEKLANQSKASIECRAAVHVLLAERATRKIPGLPAGPVPRPLARAGIVGSGTMGIGIAICFANAGVPVTVVNPRTEGLRRGLAAIEGAFESMMKRGRLTAADKAKRLALITGSVHCADLSDADIVIETVVEDLIVKKSIFRELAQVARPGALLATNTSSLDIDRIAAETGRREDVIGLHFFAPANVMPLLEVARTESTSPTAIRTAIETAKLLRKTPVLTRASFGFIGNRMMEGYAREAQLMVLEGATPRQVDAAMENWGMAMGILGVFDMAGIDVGVSVHKANAEKYPRDPTYHQADVALYSAGRLGQKSGKGYYRYLPGDRTRHDDPEALEILRAAGARLGVQRRTHTDEEIVERCLFPLISEGFRILEEGIALRAADIDVVWTSGYGFPRWRGGPMFYAETLGLEATLQGMLKYRAQFGPMHWQPAPLLEWLVAEGYSATTEPLDRRSHALTHLTEE